ncbi:MAG: hypothetical protein WDN00_06805 [Limisphaerales bacterium]
MQEHLSGWLPEEMRQRGYQVTGMHGPKSLRGEYASLKHRPKALWGMVSVTAHYSYHGNAPKNLSPSFAASTSTAIEGLSIVRITEPKHGATAQIAGGKTRCCS